METTQRTNDVFSAVESTDSRTKGKRASWVGQLSIDLPSLEMKQLAYNVKAAKVEGSLQKVDVQKVYRGKYSWARDQGVVTHYVGRLLRYREEPAGAEMIKERRINPDTGEITEREIPRVSRVDEQPISYDDAKEHVRYIADDGKTWKISARSERATFLSDPLAEFGQFIDVQESELATLQNDGTEVSKFDRTKTIEIVEEDGSPNCISMQRLAEYKFSDIYMLRANTDDKVRESNKRVYDLCQVLQSRQLALLAPFSWGRGFNYYTAVVFPYFEKESDKVWLLMGMSEGTLQLDTAWAVMAHDDEPVKSVKTSSAPKPKMRIAK